MFDIIILVFLLFLECFVGYYGENCSVSCGYCFNNVVCDYIIGICV